MKTRTAKNMLRLAFAVGALLFLSGLFFQGHLEMKQMEWPRLASTLRLISYAVYYLAIAAGAWLGWSLLVRLAEWATPLLATQEAEITVAGSVDEPLVQQAPEIKQTLVSLDERLKAISEEKGATEKTAKDIQYQCTQLAKLTREFIRQGEARRRDAEAFQAALDLLGKDEKISPVKRGAIIAKIPDPDFKALFRAKTQDPDYWEEVFERGGEYITTLQQWGQRNLAYGVYLAGQVGYYKVQIAELTEVCEYGQTAQPLLTSQDLLQDVSYLLTQTRERWTIFTTAYQVPSPERVRELAARTTSVTGAIPETV